MKRLLIALVVLLSCVNAFGSISSNPISVDEYVLVLKQMGFTPHNMVPFRELVGDTIRFDAYYPISEEQFYNFVLVTPDTVWVKPNKKKPVEGKHYHLLHYYGATYELDKKNAYLFDYTLGSKLCPMDQSVAFRVDRYEGDSMMYATELNSQRQIYFNPNKLSGKLLISSNKLKAQYAPLLHTTYYTYKKLNKISKKFTRHEVGIIDPYINNRGQVRLNTDLIVDGTFSTYDQYVADSLAEVKYWEEYNRPRYVDYVVYNPDAKFDSAKLGDIFRGNSDGHLYILLRSKNTSVAQAIVDGRMQDAETLEEDKLLVFVDCETIRDVDYFVVGRNGRIFYVKASQVDVDYRLELSSGTEVFENSDKIEKYRHSSEEVKKAYQDFAKALIYGTYKSTYDRVASRFKTINSKGLFITNFGVTEGYATTGLNFSLINMSKKTIKYIVITTKGMNSVDDLIETKTARCIGPIAPGEEAEYEFEHLWWTDLVYYHDPISLVITYMDGSSMTLKSRDIEACWDDDDFESDREGLKQFMDFKTGVMNASTNTVEPYPALPF